MRAWQQQHHGTMTMREGDNDMARTHNNDKGHMTTMKTHDYEDTQQQHMETMQDANAGR